MTRCVWDIVNNIRTTVYYLIFGWQVALIIVHTHTSSFILNPNITLRVQAGVSQSVFTSLKTNTPCDKSKGTWADFLTKEITPVTKKRKTNKYMNLIFKAVWIYIDK